MPLKVLIRKCKMFSRTEEVYAMYRSDKAAAIQCFSGSLLHHWLCVCVLFELNEEGPCVNTAFFPKVCVGVNRAAAGADG